MSAIIQSLIVFALLHDVKAEMIARYPSYELQIRQVGLPSIRYRHHIWFDWELKGFLLGKCDVTARWQVQVVRDRNLLVTRRRMGHEFRHFIRQAAALPILEDRRIDGK